MVYREIVMDIFDISDDYYIAHCVSADFELGAGIAKSINNHFDVKNSIYPLINSEYNPISRWDNQDNKGFCIRTGRIFNLVTKRNYYNKPTYDSLYNSLVDCKDICKSYNIDFLCMPKIGCGLDKLEWSKVEDIIQSVFKDTDMNIIVCKLN